ncbi:hypothetical protein, partial [Marinitenerispora sediminis]|uniref:hypothetical protein n=1 Tax=Marinitenerispora sediminis TaxID=1931232 RepID=UPI001C6A69AD
MAKAGWPAAGDGSSALTRTSANLTAPLPRSRLCRARAPRRRYVERLLCCGRTDQRGDGDGDGG